MLNKNLKFLILGLLSATATNPVFGVTLDELRIAATNFAIKAANAPQLKGSDLAPFVKKAVHEFTAGLEPVNVTCGEVVDMKKRASDEALAYISANPNVIPSLAIANLLQAPYPLNRLGQRAAIIANSLVRHLDYLNEKQMHLMEEHIVIAVLSTYRLSNEDYETAYNIAIPKTQSMCPVS